MFDLGYCVIYNYYVKSRALLSMLITFIVLAGIWIMGGTVFIVDEIQIKLDGKGLSASSSEPDLEKNIIEKINLQGKNILFGLDEEEISESVKAVSPTLKVVNVKSEFPNRVVIDVIRRSAIYNNGTLLFDEDMVIVGGGTSGLANIMDTNIELKSTNAGDVAEGKTIADNKKIDQLKIIGNYFEEMEGWKVSYDDSSNAIGANMLCMNILMNDGSSLRMTTGYNEDFIKLLTYTYSSYRNNRTPGQNELFSGYYNENQEIRIIKYNQANEMEKVYYE